MAKKRHHWIVRVTHWVNVVARHRSWSAPGSASSTRTRRSRGRARLFCCYPWEGQPVPAWLTFGGWLAGARNWHFAMMWVLVVNGLVYLAFVYLHGEWRDLVPRAATSATLADGEVLRLQAKGSSAPGQAQRAAEDARTS